MPKGAIAVAGALLLLPCPANFCGQFAAASDPTTSDSVTMTGILEVLQEDDFANHQTRISYSLIDSTGRRYELLLDSIPDSLLRTGSTVSVKGQVRGEKIVADGRAVRQVGPMIDGAAATVGVRNLMVLVTNFSDSPVRCRDSTIAELMFTGAWSVDGLFQASSYGQLSFPSDTDADGQPDVLRVRIEASVQDTCDPYAWARAADEAAITLGADLNLYQHRLYVVPNYTTCWWGGLANVGCGSYCRSWIRFCDLPDIYAHELGHNLFMAHASTDLDNDGVIDCEYCDTSDFMGYGGIGWRMLNGPHQDQMDWLPSGQILDVAEWGTTTQLISPLHENPTLALYPQILRIPKPHTDCYYYLSYRQPRHQYELHLPMEYRDRVSVHTYCGIGYRRTSLVGILQDDYTFEDIANDVSITLLGHGTNFAVVQVSSRIDTFPPDPIDDLAVTVRRKDEVTLTWSPVQDGESGLLGYRVYRDGVLLGSTENTTYEDATAVFKDTYSYLVAAYDEAGNESLGNTVYVTIRGYGRCKEGKKNKHCAMVQPGSVADDDW